MLTVEHIRMLIAEMFSKCSASKVLTQFDSLFSCFYQILNPCRCPRCWSARVASVGWSESENISWAS